MSEEFDAEEKPETNSECLKYVEGYLKSMKDEDLFLRTEEASQVMCTNDDDDREQMPFDFSMCDASREEYAERMDEINSSGANSLFPRRKIALAQALYRSKERFDEYRDYTDGSYEYSVRLFAKWIRRAYESGFLSSGDGLRRKYKQSIKKIRDLQDDISKLNKDLKDAQESLQIYDKARKKEALRYDQSTKEEHK